MKQPTTSMKTFFRFLKTNNLYQEYINYFECFGHTPNELYNWMPEDYVDNAFHWIETIQGHEFWAELHEKWTDICEREF